MGERERYSSINVCITSELTNILVLHRFRHVYISKVTELPPGVSEGRYVLDTNSRVVQALATCPELSFI
jgi:hypothetical protein